MCHFVELVGELIKRGLGTFFFLHDSSLSHRLFHISRKQQQKKQKFRRQYDKVILECGPALHTLTSIYCCLVKTPLHTEHFDVQHEKEEKTVMKESREKTWIYSLIFQMLFSVRMKFIVMKICALEYHLFPTPARSPHTMTHSHTDPENGESSIWRWY